MLKLNVWFYFKYIIYAQILKNLDSTEVCSQAFWWSTGNLPCDRGTVWSYVHFWQHNFKIPWYFLTLFFTWMTTKSKHAYDNKRSQRQLLSWGTLIFLGLGRPVHNSRFFPLQWTLRWPWEGRAGRHSHRQGWDRQGGGVISRDGALVRRNREDLWLHLDADREISHTTTLVMSPEQLCVC